MGCLHSKGVREFDTMAQIEEVVEEVKEVVEEVKEVVEEVKEVVDEGVVPTSI